MTLHLIELPLSLRSLHLWAGGRKLKSQTDEGVALHHLLGEVFGPAVLQPFRLLVAPRAQTGTLYAYAANEASVLQGLARSCLTPSHAEVIALDRLRSLPRPASTWTVGQSLGFDLRVRPVVRLASALLASNESGTQFAFGKGAEVDAFVAAVLRGKQSMREAAYLDWISTRLAPGAMLDPSITRLAGFERNRIQRDGKSLEGPDAVVHGTLTVTDPVAFAELLARGVGRHRSYGYGMLLLRPPQRARQC